MDLEAQRVHTVAGTGEQVYLAQSSAPAHGTGLNTPWDVLYRDGLVYIAMSGQHQIWTYDPEADPLPSTRARAKKRCATGRA